MPRPVHRDWIGLVILVMSLLTTTATAVWWLSRQLHTVGSTVERIERQTRGRWTAQDMKLWTTQLESENRDPGLPLSVPDPWRVVAHHNHAIHGGK